MSSLYFPDAFTLERAFAYAPFWRDIYIWSGQLPSCVDLAYVSDEAIQRSGRDRDLFFDDETVKGAEEKLRFCIYRDMALETDSCFELGTPGWIYNLDNADYLTYVNMLRGIAHIIPAAPFRWVRDKYVGLWERFAEQEKRGYLVKYAKNRGYRDYHSRILCVPMDDFLFKIDEAGKELGLTEGAKIVSFEFDWRAWLRPREPRLLEYLEEKLARLNAA